MNVSESGSMAQSSVIFKPELAGLHHKILQRLHLDLDTFEYEVEAQKYVSVDEKKNLIAKLGAIQRKLLVQFTNKMAMKVCQRINNLQVSILNQAEEEKESLELRNKNQMKQMEGQIHNLKKAIEISYRLENQSE